MGRKKADHPVIKIKPMSKRQYRTAIKAIGHNQSSICPVVDVGLRTSQSYASGELVVPGHIATMLRLLCAGKITVTDIIEVNR